MSPDIPVLPPDAGRWPGPTRPRLGVGACRRGRCGAAGIASCLGFSSMLPRPSCRLPLQAPSRKPHLRV
jgi:hypothetical protein